MTKPKKTKNSLLADLEKLQAYFDKHDNEGGKDCPMCWVEEENKRLHWALQLYRDSHNTCVEKEPQGLCNKCRIAEGLFKNRIINHDK